VINDFSDNAGNGARFTYRRGNWSLEAQGRFEGCMDDRPPALSFAALDARIEAMPEGPA